MSSLGNWTDSNESEDSMAFASYSEDESGYRSPQKRKITRPRSAILANRARNIEQDDYRPDKGKSPPQPKKRRCSKKSKPPDGEKF